MCRTVLEKIGYALTESHPSFLSMAWKPCKLALFSLPYVEANEYGVLRACLPERTYSWGSQASSIKRSFRFLHR